MIRPSSGIDLSGLLRFDTRLPAARETGRFERTQSLLLEQSLTGLSDQLRVVRAALEQLHSREAAAATTGPGSRVAAASSISPLALEAVARPTTLTSTEEVNTIATSFTPFGPVVSGATTSLPTVGGVYSGAQGDDTLTFEFRRNAVVGSSQRLNVRVEDGQGKRIDTLRFEDLPAGTPLTLSNGLTLSLGAGSVTRNDTFTVQVSTSVGSRVDPTKPFDGTRNERPNFEPGTSVGAGSFEVNGVVIDVAADDSIDSVLAKINASSAGVTASFDAASESVVLRHDELGPNTTIVLGNDTSNFLAATKLAAATAIPGQDETLANDPIAEVPALSAIGSGTFSINGVVLSVDTASDSLEDVVARINASSAGATATFDRDTQVLSLRSRSKSDSLVLDDGTSGFFSAVGVAPTTYLPSRRAGNRSGFQQLSAVRKDLFELRRGLNGLFRPPSSRQVSEFDMVRDRLRDAVTSSFESILEVSSPSVLRSGFGLDFHFDEGLNVVAFDHGRFEQASIESFDALQDFLFRDDEGPPGEQGLLVALLAQTNELQDLVEKRLGRLDPTGQIIDLLT